jgi:glioma pathogenesis-related protein 2
MSIRVNANLRDGISATIIDSAINENEDPNEGKPFVVEFLDEHNKLRAIHGNVPPLELDDELSVRAQQHAEFLAETESKLVNSSHEDVGENLYYYLSPNNNEVKASNVVNHWVKKAELDNSDEIKDTSSFTQMIWKNTKKLGVGYAQASNGASYLVAFYKPRGNIKNKIAENVLFKPSKKN